MARLVRRARFILLETGLRFTLLQGDEHEH